MATIILGSCRRSYHCRMLFSQAQKRCQYCTRTVPLVRNSKKNEAETVRVSLRAVVPVPIVHGGGGGRGRFGCAAREWITQSSCTR